MAMAAVLRSVATKMPRPPPRLPGTSAGLCLSSRFSTSTGSTPGNLKGPPTFNKEVPSGSAWGSFIGGVISAAPLAAYGMVFGGITFIQFYVIPAMDRIIAQREAICDELVTLSEEMKMRREQSERLHPALDTMGSQMEVRDVGEFSKGGKIQASGQCQD